MKRLTRNKKELFLALVRSGLWEKEARLSQFGGIDYDATMQLAEEQSVVGLVTAGLEHVQDVKVPQEELLQFIGSTLQIEQQNQSMNDFLAKLIGKLRKEEVYAILAKGQGVAQCYERPLWRTSGDIDLLLDEKNYEKAKEVLFPIADHVACEDPVTKHQGLSISDFEVELHGRMPFFLSRRVDDIIDEVLVESLNGNEHRVWKLGETDVHLPNPNNDVIIVFTHFLLHFFVEGVGMRQICDWCRLLWRYRAELNLRLLESRIRKMGLMTEWKVFGALAVNTLGMPKEAMPMLNENDNENEKLKGKAEKVLERILKSGNMGHNNDLSYRSKYSGLTYKAVAMWRRFVDFASLVPVFPMDAPRFFVRYLVGKV